MPARLQKLYARIPLTQRVVRTIGSTILEGIMVDKFIVPKDKDYDSVREMERWLAKNAPAPAAAAPAGNPAVVPASVPAK